MSWTKTRSLIATAKHRDPNADVTDLQRQLRAEVLANYITKVVSQAPPLTRAQRDELAMLLRGTDDTDDTLPGAA